MKKKIAMVSSLFFLAVCSHVASADDFSAGLKVSTLGPGVEVEQRFGTLLGVRLGVNYLPISRNYSVDDIRYDADFSWESASLLADFYPFAGIFRITGGFFYNGNTADVSATPQGDVQIADHTYNAAGIGTITGSVDFNELAPYAGIGWSAGHGASGDWTVSVDLGVMFQGSPSVSSLSASGPLSSDPAFNADLDQERDNIKDKMDSFKYYPVVAFAVSYHF